MIPIISLLATLVFSILTTRIATMALMLTGLSREVARFQARSAFTGVGYTSAETESVVEHPVRRQIVYWLMLTGNIGIATVVATVMLSFMDTRTNNNWAPNAGLLVVGLILIWVFASSRWMERQLNKTISWALRKFTQMEVRDYVAVLNLQDGFAVTEMRVEEHDWLANKTLQELALPREGVLVLGVNRPGRRFIGTPTAHTVVQAGDVLILYGSMDRITELDQRRAGRRGDVAHAEAIDELLDLLDEQSMEDDDSSKD
jgi:hypothetical protein